MPRVFLTIDTEFAWRHHAAGLDADAVHARSIQPAGVGLSWQLHMLAEHDLKATFFVDPTPAAMLGGDHFARVVAAIEGAGQEVQLHLHPQWTGDGFELIEHDADTQQRLIAAAAERLVASGARYPVAFRAGSYSANDDTLAALAALGIAYDSSHNGAEHPWPSAIGLPPERIAPVARAGVIEVPVTVIEEVPGRYRNAQTCALSAGEMRAALDHAVRANHAAVTIVGHSFELANRAGTRANRVHARRFVDLCHMLAARRDVLPTTHFRDRPDLPLNRDDRPLPAHGPRRRWRQVEQVWSNLIEERAW